MTGCSLLCVSLAVGDVCRDHKVLSPAAANTKDRPCVPQALCKYDMVITNPELLKRQADLYSVSGNAQTGFQETADLWWQDVLVFHV